MRFAISNRRSHQWSIMIVAVTAGLLIGQVGSAWAQDEHTVGLWHFDEGDGEDVMDVSENQLHGIQVGCEWEKGRFGAALRIAQAGSHVAIPHSEVLDLQVFSVEFWTRYTDPPVSPSAFMSNRGWIVGDKMTGFTLRDETGLMLEVLTRGKVNGDKIEADDWLYIAMTYDAGGNVRFYMNGELRTEKPAQGELIYKDESLWIGAEPSGGYGFADNGADILMDEIRISDVLRTDQEVLTVFEEGYGGLAVSPRSKLAVTWASRRTSR